MLKNARRFAPEMRVLCLCLQQLCAEYRRIALRPAICKNRANPQMLLTHKQKDDGVYSQNADRGYSAPDARGCRAAQKDLQELGQPADSMGPRGAV